MNQIVLSGIDDDTVQSLKASAARSGLSVEDYVQHVLEVHEARTSRAAFAKLARDIRDRVAARNAGKPPAEDSVTILRRLRGYED
ncbi:FitA-like ribbon-helix-helix domain-containing protein [Mongoliimonas terrestris]|uniref:FitA-like ribbon-helix-helix domain-containing protein n=1 Tax=Mongoliimonas terrestris TaxID=1709001 RepID=UPI00094959DF|nr:hypothetical protein [Mongoliimonas terrestris]